jgi:hypothetical protein
MKLITPILTFLKENGKYLLFSLLMLRPIVLGATISSALIVLCFLAFFGFESFLKQKQQPNISGQLSEDIEKLKGKVSQLTLGSLYAKK